MTADTVTEISESDARTTYAVTRRIYEGSTSVGTDVLIADSPVYGRMLFLDGELQSASADEWIYHTSLVHPAMANAEWADETARVLVVGGGEGATVREVLRWPGVRWVDWVDYDRDLVDLCREHLDWAPAVYDDRRVHFIGADISDVAPALGAYTVVILDLPDPDGETGWLYSDEFWRTMRGLLQPTGVLVTHCGPVRPFGDIGAGFQRVRGALVDTAGFYSVSIPSFQGEWGFWLWSPNGAPDPARRSDVSEWHAQFVRTPIWDRALGTQHVGVEAAELEE